MKTTIKRLREYFEKAEDIKASQYCYYDRIGESVIYNEELESKEAFHSEFEDIDAILNKLNEDEFEKVCCYFMLEKQHDELHSIIMKICED